MRLASAPIPACLLLLAMGACAEAGGDGRGDGGGAADVGVDSGNGPDGAVPSPLRCAPWPAAEGETVEVGPSQAATLHEIVADAAPGTTVRLQPGTYPIAGSLRFRAPEVTLRSTTDDARDVTIDGGYEVAETVVIQERDVTVAHVTIQRAVDHPVHIAPGGEGPDVLRPVLYGLRIVDGGEQFVKINDNAGHVVDDGRVECSSFRLTDDGRPHIEREPGGCYTGGIDAHAARGWVVRNNRFEDIYCAGEGLAEHAVHFWSGSRDTLVENNLIVNCARGIGFGLGGDQDDRTYDDDPHGGLVLSHVDGLIRNNVIYADVPWYDTGIELQNTRRPTVLHNTVVSTADATGFFRSIDYRFEVTRVEIRNNLTRVLGARDGAQGEVDHNLQDTPLGYFVDPAGLDFHLVPDAADAIDQGVSHEAAGVDLDGAPHEAGAPDLGADELGAP